MAADLPPEKLVQSLLSGTSPCLSVLKIEAIPSTRLQLLYNVKVSEGPNLLLALSPPAVLRLLRSEQSSIASEAAVLKWLTTVSSDKKISSSDKSLGRPRINGGSIFKYLPTLLKHERLGCGVSPEFNLSQPPNGLAMTALPRSLASHERRSVDFQIGKLLRTISSHTSPTQKFGLAADVLAVPPSPSQLRRPEGGLHATRGADSWSIAFRALLESILRDGEDSSVMINYAAIRKHFDRFHHLLDAVSRPRLVVMDAGEDANTLVLEHSGSKNVISSATDGHDDRNFLDVSKSRKDVLQNETILLQRYSDQPPSTTEPTQDNVEVTGLRQWTSCLFGDPLVATIFTTGPSKDFWDGFEGPGFRGGPGLIEDECNVHVRLLLYECYHAVIAVVKQFYRPHSDSEDTELAARRHLGNVLARLDGLDDRGLPKRRRVSGEISPAKRSKASYETDL